MKPQHFELSCFVPTIISHIFQISHIDFCGQFWISAVSVTFMMQMAFGFSMVYFSWYWRTQLSMNDYIHCKVNDILPYHIHATSTVIDWKLTVLMSPSYGITFPKSSNYAQSKCSYQDLKPYMVDLFILILLFRAQGRDIINSVFCITKHLMIWYVYPCDDLYHCVSNSPMPHQMGSCDTWACISGY